MLERRYEVVGRLTEAGLPAPDEDTLAVLRDVVDEGVLGASNHVALTLPLIARIADEEADPVTAFAAARETAAFIAETRGAGAPILANALAWQMSGVDGMPPHTRAAELTRRAEAWSKRAAARRRALIEAARDTLKGCRAPLAFDYSSTVADILRDLASRGTLEEIILPESRAVDGGRRYAEALADLGVALRMVPDAAIVFAVARCDVVLLGAESVTADGGVLNTIGSLPYARAAADAGIPVYGAADLFKVGAVAAADWPAPAPRRYAFLETETTCVFSLAPELELVAPELLRGLLTEEGPLTPPQIGPAAERAREVVP